MNRVHARRSRHPTPSSDAATEATRVDGVGRPVISTRREHDVDTVRAAARVPGVEPSPSTELWSRLSATDAFDPPKAPSEGRTTRQSSAAEATAPGHAVRAAAHHINFLHDVAARGDVSNGTQSGGGGAFGIQSGVAINLHEVPQERRLLVLGRSLLERRDRLLRALRAVGGALKRSLDTTSAGSG